MPGFVGITGKDAAKSVSDLRESKDLLIYHAWHHHKLFEQPHFFLSQVTGYESLHIQHYCEHGDVSVWVDGEYYNPKTFSWLLDGSSGIEKGEKELGLADLLALAAKTGHVEDVCKKIDGEFTAIIYLKEEKTIQIISDRHGLRPLYLWDSGSGFVFATELKAFLKFSQFSLKFSNRALESFLSFGHLLGGDTWFEGVNLIPPATILTLSLEDNTAKEKMYWGWGNIPTSSLPFDQAVDQLNEELRGAVTSRVFNEETFSVLLSGGLDSRVILGMSPTQRCIGTLTFGEKKCLDSVLAQKVSDVLNIPNHFYEIDPENWFKQRLHAVWRSDGLSSVTDLHASQFLNNMRRISPVTINGYLGDPIVGAVYLPNTQWFNKRIDKDIAQKLYGKYAEELNWNSKYFDCEHVDPFIIANRGRRLILSGVREAALTFEQRKPFLANSLVEFLYGLPDEYRMERKMYYEACQRALPELFTNIPYQLTGLTLRQGTSSFWKMTRKVKRIPSKLGLAEDQSQLLNYGKIFKLKSTKKIFEDILYDQNSLIGELVTNDKLSRLYHSSEKADWQSAGRALTLEIWLQQVVNGKYREL